MATLYMLQPFSTLYLKSSMRPKSCILRPRVVSKALSDKKIINGIIYRKTPFLWRKTLSRGSLMCNFFKQSVEEEDKENYNRIEDGEVKDHRRPFNLNLAVVLAGFAFEAYTTPPEKAGVHEIDAGDCETVFLSELFLRDIYDGQLFVKLKKGVNLPAMDPWEHPQT